MGNDLMWRKWATHVDVWLWCHEKKFFKSKKKEATTGSSNLSAKLKQNEGTNIDI